MIPLGIRRHPPVDQGKLRFVASDESVRDVPEKWLDAAYDIDSTLRLIPGPEFDQLVLTAEDRPLLWSCGIEGP